MTMLQTIGNWLAGHQPLPDKPAVRRSGKWPEVRKTHLKASPTCVACGAAKRLEVHHILPFHAFPLLELDRDNLLTLCEGDGCNCHFTFGHLLDWRSWNSTVIEDCRTWLAKVKVRPKRET